MDELNGADKRLGVSVGFQWNFEEFFIRSGPLEIYFGFNDCRNDLKNI